MSSQQFLVFILVLLGTTLSSVYSEKSSKRRFYQISERKVKQQVRRLPGHASDTLTFSGDVEKIIDRANSRGRDRKDDGNAVVVVSSEGGGGGEGEGKSSGADADPFSEENTETLNAATHMPADGDEECNPSPEELPAPEPAALSITANSVGTAESLPTPSSNLLLTPGPAPSTTFSLEVSFTGVPANPSPTTKAPTQGPTMMPMMVQQPTPALAPSPPTSKQPVVATPVSIPEFIELSVPTGGTELPVVADSVVPPSHATFDGSESRPSPSDTTSSGSETSPTPNLAPTHANIPSSGAPASPSQSNSPAGTMMSPTDANISESQSESAPTSAGDGHFPGDVLIDAEISPNNANPGEPEAGLTPAHVSDEHSPSDIPADAVLSPYNVIINEDESGFTLEPASNEHSPNHTPTMIGGSTPAPESGEHSQSETILINGTEGGSVPEANQSVVTPAPPVALPTSSPVAMPSPSLPLMNMPTPTPVASPVLAPVQTPTNNQIPSSIGPNALSPTTTHTQPASSGGSPVALTPTPSQDSFSENEALAPTMYANTATEPTVSENAEPTSFGNEAPTININDQTSPSGNTGNHSPSLSPIGSTPTSSPPTGSSVPPPSNADTAEPPFPKPVASQTAPTPTNNEEATNTGPSGLVPTLSLEVSPSAKIPSAPVAGAGEIEEEIVPTPSLPLSSPILAPTDHSELDGEPTPVSPSASPILGPTMHSGLSGGSDEATLLSPAATPNTAPTVNTMVVDNGTPSLPSSGGESGGDQPPSSESSPGNFMSPTNGSDPGLVQDSDSNADGSSSTVAEDATHQAPTAAPVVPAITLVSCDESVLDRFERIEFMYSLETSTNDEALIEDIRRSSELALSRDIANLLLPCDVRRLQTDNALGFEGIDHVPEDSRTDTDCDASVDIKNGCAVFDGILTVYISEGADFDLAKYYTLTAIREAMGLLDRQVSDLVKATYLGPEIVNPSAFETSEIGNGDIAPGPSNLNTSLVLFAVGGCAFAASVGLIYYLRRHGNPTSSGAATQAAASDQYTHHMEADRPLSPFSEMLPSAYRFDQDGNMSAILELDDESATQRSGIVVSDSGFTTEEEEGSVAISSLDGTSSLNRHHSPVLGARKRHDESMDSLLELL